VSYDVSSKIAGHFCVLVYSNSSGANRADPLAQLPRLAAQAAGIMVEPGHLCRPLPPGLPTLLVPSTWEGLQALATAARSRFA
jgi:hypothetical protein